MTDKDPFEDGRGNQPCLQRHPSQFPMPIVEQDVKVPQKVFPEYPRTAA